MSKSMKVLMVTDMEGVDDIFDKELQGIPNKSPRWEESRKLLTGEINAAVEAEEACIKARKIGLDRLVVPQILTHNLPQFRVLRADSCSTDCLHQLHIRVQKAFAQHTLGPCRSHQKAGPSSLDHSLSL
jgi:hypothetical protein